MAFAPLAALRWEVDGEAVPYLVVSAALELAYLALLAAAYGRAELSVVYPVARGLAPVLVLSIGVTVLDAATSAGEVAGVLLIALGIVLVRGVRTRDRPGLLFGVAIGACIAGYTLADARGVDHADPWTYLWLVLAPSSLVYFAVVARNGGRPRLTPELGWTPLAVGVGAFGAFGLALAALQRASAASVAAVRETSIVIAVALAAPILKEPVGGKRLAGAVVVAAGIALLAAT